MELLEKTATEILKEIGIKEGHVVLDFGCGSGTYAIPAAQLVVEKGRVYALDKAWWGIWQGEGLGKLAQRVVSQNLKNIVIIKTSKELNIALEDKSIDVVLLYDVLHSYYFPQDEIKILLQDINRILKPNGFLSFYPGDPEVSSDYSQLENIKKEIENTGFYPETKYAGEVVHENIIVKGSVTNFRKMSFEKYENKKRK